MADFVEYIKTHSSKANMATMEVFVNNTQETAQSTFYYDYTVTMEKNANGKTYGKFDFKIEEW